MGAGERTPGWGPRRQQRIVRSGGRWWTPAQADGWLPRNLPSHRPRATTARPHRSLLSYFLLVFVLAWTLWALGSLLTAPSARSRLRALFFLPGTFAPAMVAVRYTRRERGSVGARRLLEPMAAVRVQLR